MKILITGTHLTPAVAVINELKRNHADLVYVGRKFTLEGDDTISVESKVLPSLGIKFIPITTGRLQKTFTFYTIISLFKIPIGFFQSFFILAIEKPDVVLSFGGYVSVPVIFSSWLFSIPIIIHEQTLVSSLANRIGALFAQKHAVSFNFQQNGKTILTGNPLRKEIISPNTRLEKDYQKIFQEALKNNLHTILVIGGSQGSHIINETVDSSLDKLLKISCVIHQTGDSKFGDFERLKMKSNERYIIKKWIDGGQLGSILKKVDLVISRAGANTLLELAISGKPALVIPISYLYQNEQNKNAKYFANLGLVKILPQSKLTSITLVENIRSMLNNLSALKKQAKRAKKEVYPDAAKRLALETLLLAKER